KPASGTITAFPAYPYDDRVWFASGNYLFTAALPESKSAGGTIGPGAIVRIESALGNAEWDRRIEKVLAAKVEERGGKIGPGGWPIRVSHRVEDMAALEMKAGESIPAPHLIATLEFRSPEGGSDTRTAEGAFLFESSAYYLRTVKPGNFGGPRKVF